MRTHRREILLGAAAASSLALPSRLFAQAGDLIRKPIPSTGEMLPVIGLGSARRYEEAASADDLASLRETLQRFQALGGKVIDTAPVYGTAESTIGALLEKISGRDSLFLATK